jgi:hypothetical protein
LNRYFKEFLHRGLIFGGFGPIILGIIYAVVSETAEDFTLSGMQILLAIISTYAIAFIQAGATVLNQIEHWPVMKGLLCHFSLIYITYSGCYILNSWIPFDIAVIGIFTAIFVAVYIAIWVIVYFATKGTSRKLNAKLD